MKDITSSLTKKKNSRSSLWVQLWVRKASFPVSYLFINAGWSANMVSVLSWVLIFVAAVCLCINNFWWMFAGVVLTNFWLVLDCVDGNIARVKKVRTFMGDFFDAVAGYGPFSFTTLALGVAAYNTTILVPVEMKHWLIIR
jgi:phosphatidylglycerophosphate synthase